MELVDIKGIGPVLFQVSKKAKRLSIRIKPFDGIKVTVPYGYSPKEAIQFVITNKNWIQQSLEKIKLKEGDLTIFDEQTDFKTHSFCLNIEKAQISNLNIRLKDSLLNIQYPSHMDIKTPVLQDNIRYAIEEALRITAKNHLPQRLHHFAQLHEFNYNRVFIKNLKSRWGSCSNVNNINLNLHLMRLPDHLIDAVILHELCHTVEKNHGKGFWQLMDKVTNGKAKTLDKEIKNYRTTIY